MDMTKFDEMTRSSTFSVECRPNDGGVHIAVRAEGPTKLMLDSIGSAIARMSGGDIPMAVSMLNSIAQSTMYELITGDMGEDTDEPSLNATVDLATLRRLMEGQGESSQTSE